MTSGSDILNHAYFRLEESDGETTKVLAETQGRDVTVSETPLEVFGETVDYHAPHAQEYEALLQFISRVQQQAYTAFGALKNGPANAGGLPGDDDEEPNEVDDDESPAVNSSEWSSVRSNRGEENGRPLKMRRGA